MLLFKIGLLKFITQYKTKLIQWEVFLNNVIIKCRAERRVDTSFKFSSAFKSSLVSARRSARNLKKYISFLSSLDGMFLTEKLI
jgi:hypothetical protein